MTKPTTEVKNRWNRSHYDFLTVQIPKGEKELIRKEAEKEGMSIQAWVREAIKEKRGV